MKKITLFLLLSMVIVFSAEAHKYRNRNAHITISIQTFYDQLSPYGDWIYSSDYGYVWRPYFDYPESFRPYSSNGNWVYTTYGWTWVSDYNWGWATFHYGRWDFDNYLGWLWIPGYEWAPAWVTWGSYNNYWGWAPMGPNIYAQYNSNWYAPDPWWTFVPQRHFCSGNWNNYIYDRPVHVSNITNITNIYVDNSNRNSHNSWYEGPRVSDVERYNGRRVKTVEVVDNQRADNTGLRNNRLNVYRPTVETRNSSSRPTEFRNAEQARRGGTTLTTSARTNNPGENRTRESKSINRNSAPVPVQRNEAVTRENRKEINTSTQAPGTRSTEIKRDSKVEPRATPQTAPRNGSVNRETRIDQRNTPQAPVNRNSTRPASESRKEAPDRESNARAIKGNRSDPTPARVENPENRQSRSSVPAQEKVTRSVNSSSENRQASGVQQTREQRTQNTAPAQTTHRENGERKQDVQVEAKQAELKKAASGSDRNSNGNPGRR